MRPKRNDLTAFYIRKILDYDPETGVLTWRERTTPSQRGGQYAVGKPAGSRKKGQIMIGIRDQRYCAHRLAWLWMTGEWPLEIDHVNRDPFDNRWFNLREATRSQNNVNRKATVPFRGVRRTRGGKWQARIKYQGKERHLGHFPSAEEASDAYRRAAQAHWGDFHQN